MAAERRRARGLLALAAHLALAFGLVPLWLLTRRADRARKLEQRFFRRALRAIGVQVRQVGEPSRRPATLFLANHVSFTDVLALATLVDAAFVAKADVARWPMMGRLVARYGTIFVARGRGMEARRQSDRIAARLARGESIVLFPEGTTSDGEGVLPFRSALLAAAAAARVVQPVALRYSDGARRGYVGDESMLANLVRLAPHRARLDMIFLPPSAGGPEVDRKRLALAAAEAISDALSSGGAARTAPAGSPPT